MKRIVPLLATALLIFAACGEPEADRIGLGAECGSDDDCHEDLDCLQDFGGGYCGLSGCEAHADCPDYSSCVEYDDDSTYCFRDCENKAECNANRSRDREANCSSNIDFVEPTDLRACVPPSS